VDGAVELGMKTADRFDLCGQDLLAQKTALLCQRNPEFPDVAQSLATYRSTVILNARSQSAAFSHGST